jgi:hypothetical protein
MEDDEALATTSEITQKKKGGQLQLQFVTTVSVNLPSTAEKKRNQKIIRQTVMKNFRQQQKSEKLPPKGKSNRGLAAASSIKPDSDEDGMIEPFSSASWTSIKPKSSSWSESDDAKELGNNESRHCVLYQSRTSSAMRNPFTPLGAGRSDPFCSYSGDNKYHMNELIDHCEYLRITNSQLSA